MRSRRGARDAVLVPASTAAPAFREILPEYVERLPGFRGSIPSSVPLVGRREALSIHSQCQRGAERKPQELCGFRSPMWWDASALRAVAAANYFAPLRRPAQ